MLKKTLIILALISLVAGCTTCKNITAPSGGGEPPVILDSYAPERIRPGTSWRVYLKAEDPDGDIHYIASQLFQYGVGYYPTDFTYLKGEDREGFAGYIYLNTPANSLLLIDNLKLELTILDCEGNRSEPVTLPLSFDNKSSYKPQEPPEKWQMAANNKLGAILVDITSTQEFSDDDGNNGKIVP